MTERERQKFVEATKHWWWCDNIVHPFHEGQMALLKMSEPQCFILLRDMADAYFARWEDFKRIAEINFFNPADRASANLEEILINAYNFVRLQDEENERQCILGEMEDIMEGDAF
jgi:hypothetical protein